MVGASIALSISDIPWNGPIGGVFVGRTEEEGFIINPTAEQRERSSLELTVAGTEKKVVMIEAGANELPDDDMYDAIMLAHEEIKKLVAFINSIVAEIGKPKFDYPSCEIDHDLFDAVYEFCAEDVKVALDTDDKNIRDARMAPITEAVYNKFDNGDEAMHVVLDEVLYKIQKQIVRRWLLDEQKRVDG